MCMCRKKAKFRRGEERRFSLMLVVCLFVLGYSRQVRIWQQEHLIACNKCLIARWRLKVTSA